MKWSIRITIDQRIERTAVSFLLVFFSLGVHFEFWFFLNFSMCTAKLIVVIFEIFFQKNEKFCPQTIRNTENYLRWIFFFIADVVWLLLWKILIFLFVCLPDSYFSVWLYSDVHLNGRELKRNWISNHDSYVCL